MAVECKGNPALEKRANEILDKLGLNKLDIKIYTNNNGKENIEEAHVSKPETQTKAEKKKEKKLNVGNLILGDCIHEFNKNTGIVADVIDKYVKQKDFDIINKHRKSLEEIIDEAKNDLKEDLKDPDSIWSKLAESIETSTGKDIFSNIDEATNRLKSIWGLTSKEQPISEENKTVKEGPAATGVHISERVEPKDIPASSSPVKTEGLSKAQVLKNFLKGEQEEFKAKQEIKKNREVNIKLFHDLFANMIDNKRFTLRRDDLDHYDAGIILSIDKPILRNIHLFDINEDSCLFDEDIIRSAAQKIVVEYGFTRCGFDISIGSMDHISPFRVYFYFN